MNLNKLSLQELLSLGYIYLLILGVLTDTIYYSFFDLHIIAHSDVLDILLSPISILTESFVIPIMILVGFIVIYFIRVKVSPKLHEKQKKKESYRQKKDIQKLDLLYSKKPTVAELVPIFALVIFSMFVGFRLGGGHKLKQRMQEKDFSYLDVITFQSSEKINTTIIGQNSLYVFYVAEGDDKLSIAPIAQNIKLITKQEKNEKSALQKNETKQISKDNIEEDSTKSQ